MFVHFFLKLESLVMDFLVNPGFLTTFQHTVISLYMSSADQSIVGNFNSVAARVTAAASSSLVAVSTTAYSSSCFSGLGCDILWFYDINLLYTICFFSFSLFVGSCCVVAWKFSWMLIQMAKGVVYTYSWDTL